MPIPGPETTSLDENTVLPVVLVPPAPKAYITTLFGTCISKLASYSTFHGLDTVVSAITTELPVIIKQKAQDLIFTPIKKHSKELIEGIGTAYDTTTEIMQELKFHDAAGFALKYKEILIEHLNPENLDPETARFFTTISPTDLPFKDFETEPARISQAKKIINALHQIGNILKQLEQTTLNPSLENASSFLKIEAEARQTAHTIFHTDIDFTSFFREEFSLLEFVKNYLSNNYTAFSSEISETGFTKTPQLGTFLGELIHEAGAFSGELDYRYLVHFLSNLSPKIQEAAELLQKTTQIQNPQVFNEEKVKQLQKVTNHLLKQVEKLQDENILTVFKVQQLIYLTQNLFYLFLELKNNILDLNEETQSFLINKVLIPIKFDFVPKLLNFVDKTEMLLYFKPGHFSDEIRLKLSYYYNLLIEYIGSNIDLIKYPELRYLEDSRFLTTRAQFAQQRIHEAQTKLLKAQSQLKKLDLFQKELAKEKFNTTYLNQLYRYLQPPVQGTNDALDQWFITTINFGSIPKIPSATDLLDPKLYIEELRKILIKQKNTLEHTITLNQQIIQHIDENTTKLIAHTQSPAIFCLNEYQGLKTFEECPYNATAQEDKEISVEEVVQLDFEKITTLLHWYENKIAKLKNAQDALNHFLTAPVETFEIFSASLLNAQSVEDRNIELKNTFKKYYLSFQPYFLAMATPENNHRHIDELLCAMLSDSESQALLARETLKKSHAFESPEGFKNYLEHFLKQCEGRRDYYKMCATQKLELQFHSTSSEPFQEQESRVISTEETEQQHSTETTTEVSAETAAATAAALSPSRRYLTIFQNIPDKIKILPSYLKTALTSPPSTSRSDFAIKHTHMSTTLREIQEKIKTFHGYLNMTMQTALTPQEKVPYPEMSDDFLAQSPKVRAIKRVHNLFYHLEQCATIIEAMPDQYLSFVNYQRWGSNWKNLSLINHLYHVYNELEGLRTDPYLSFIYSAIFQEEATLLETINTHHALYSFSEESVPAWQKAMHYFYVLPEHLAHLKSIHSLSEIEVHQLHERANETNKNLDYFINNANSYLKLFLGTPKLGALLKELKNQTIHFANNAHKLTHEHLKDIQIEALGSLLIEADQWEARFSLKPGTLCEPLKAILEEFYHHFLDGLNLPSQPHFALRCNLDLFEIRKKTLIENLEKYKANQHKKIEEFQPIADLYERMEYSENTSKMTSHSPTEQVKECQILYKKALPLIAKLLSEQVFQISASPLEKHHRLDQLFNNTLDHDEPKYSRVEQHIRLAYLYYCGLKTDSTFVESTTKEQIDFIEDARHQQEENNSQWQYHYIANQFDHFVQQQTIPTELNDLKEEYHYYLIQFFNQTKTDIVTKIKEEQQPETINKNLLIEIKPLFESFQNEHAHDYLCLQQSINLIRQLEEHVNSIPFVNTEKHAQALAVIQQAIDLAKIKQISTIPVPMRLTQMANLVHSTEFSNSILTLSRQRTWYARALQVFLNLLEKLRLYAPQTKNAFSQLKNTLALHVSEEEVAPAEAAPEPEVHLEAAQPEDPAEEDFTSEASAEEDSTSEGSLEEDSTSEASAEEDSASEASVEEDSASEDSLEENFASEASVEENSASEASVEEDPASEGSLEEDPEPEAPAEENPELEAHDEENLQPEAHAEENPEPEAPAGAVPASVEATPPKTARYRFFGWFGSPARPSTPSLIRNAP